MRNNRINLRLLCALSLILLASNGLRAMTKYQLEKTFGITEKQKTKADNNLEILLKTKSCKGCYLRGAIVPDGTELEGANLIAATIENSNLKSANFKEINAQSIYFFKSNLEGADLENAHLINSNLEGVKAEGANFEKANLYKSNLKGANFKGASFENANLDWTNLTDTNLTDTKLKGVTLKMAIVTGTIFKGAKGMTDEEVINSGAVLFKNTVLPSGKKYSG